jgi:3-deoxy-manno-octulosonate cytidylyltransferase (CMP-KDO synthetase)
VKVLGIIPARFAATRLPGKPLVVLKGKTLIQRVYENARNCRLIDRLVVATDDQRIVDHVNSFGGDVR